MYDGVFEVLQWLLFLSAVPPVQLLTGWCVTKGFAVIDQDFMSVEEVLNYLIKAKSNNASFPVSYFNLFCSGLTNICRSLYFGMDVAITVAGVRLENGNYPTLRLFFVQSGIDCT